MATKQCQSCGGTYDDVQSDQTRYFHACPPLSRPELVAAIAAGAVALPLGETVDQALERRVYERKNKRDENLKPGGKLGDPSAIVSAGAGAVDVVLVNKTPGVVVVDV